MCLRNTRTVAILFIGFAAVSMLLVPWLGQDFFPAVDAGQFTLHVRAKSGTRIEEVARLVDEIEGAVREEIPKDQLKGIIDNIGLPYSGINLTYSNSGVASAADADILVSLDPKHDPTAQFVSQDPEADASGFSRDNLLVSARGYRRADSELRIARAL